MSDKKPPFMNTKENFSEAVGGFAEAISKGIPALDLKIEAGSDFKTLELKRYAEIKDKTEQFDNHGRYKFFDEDVWKKYYIPGADGPGVYFIFNEGGMALYVGESEAAIGERVYKRRNIYKEDISIGKLEESEASKYYVIVVPFEEEINFLAPAFESYLLKHYDFAHNDKQN